MTHLFKGKTVIIIAHRLQSVKHADRILVLENGQVIQQGRFDTLVMTEGKFQQLWEAQTTRKTESLGPV
jgi:ABC-type multidrug transport system fused ATPase/permease subunit